jgi:hypothetical protein
MLGSLSPMCVYGAGCTTAYQPTRCTADGFTVREACLSIRPSVFVDGEWRLFAKPFELKGVLVCWPKKLVEKISEEGPLEPADVLARPSGIRRRAPPARSSPG